MLICNKIPPDASEAPPVEVVPLAFIFGSPRSGTTWLGKLIDSHPGVCYLHEPIHKGSSLIIHEAIQLVRRKQTVASELRGLLLNELKRVSPQFAQPPLFPKEFLSVSLRLGWAWHRLTGRPTVLPSSDIAGIRAVVVKDGLTWFSASLTDALFAKAIVLLRHPCGVVNSMLRGQHIGAMSSFPRNRFFEWNAASLESLGYSQADVARLKNDEFEALRWLVDNLSVPALNDDRHYKVFTYGQLVANTVPVLDDVLQWLGLSLVDETVSYAQHGHRRLTERFRWFLGAKRQYYALAPRSAA